MIPLWLIKIRRASLVQSKFVCIAEFQFNLYPGGDKLVFGVVAPGISVMNIWIKFERFALAALKMNTTAKLSGL